MAKLTGLFQYKGKLGQTVGRRNGQKMLSSVQETGMNIVAMAPTAVNNPKTAFQATQRMRMRAAVNFYRQIGYILNHSWQGTGYKQPSHNRFMQLALRKGDYAIPFLPKGEQSFVPGEYPISEGSLVGADVLAIEGNALQTGLYGSAGDAATLGDLASKLINANAGFYDGDKLTFIFVSARENNGNVIYAATSVQWILDTTSTTAIADADTFPLNVTIVDGRFNFSLKNFGNQGSTIVGGAIVHVRAPQSQGGSTSWQRSNTSMYISDAVLNRWMSAEAFNTALKSYQTENANVNSDWYLNTGAENNGGTSGSSSQPLLVGEYQFGNNIFSIPAGFKAATYNNKIIWVNISEDEIILYAKIDNNTISPTTHGAPSIENIIEQYSQLTADDFISLSEAQAAGVTIWG